MDSLFVQDCAELGEEQVKELSVEKLSVLWEKFQKTTESNEFENPDKCLESLLLCTAKLIFNVQYSKDVSSGAKDRLKAVIDSCAEAQGEVAHRRKICKGITNLVKKPWSYKAFEDVSKEAGARKSDISSTLSTAERNLFEMEGWIMLETRAEFLSRLGKKAIDKVCTVLHVLITFGHGLYEAQLETLQSVAVEEESGVKDFDPFKIPYSKYLQYLQVYVLLVYKEFINEKVLSTWNEKILYQVLESLMVKTTTGEQGTIFPKLKWWNEIHKVPLYLSRAGTWKGLKTNQPVMLEEFYSTWVKLSRINDEENKDPKNKSPFEEILDTLDDVCSTLNMYVIALAAIKEETDDDSIRDGFLTVYIRALTKDINEIQVFKSTHHDQPAKIQEMERRISYRYLELALFLKEFLKTAKECLITAFSLNPCQQLFECLFPERLNDPAVTTLIEPLAFDRIDEIKAINFQETETKLIEDHLKPVLVDDLDIVIHNPRYSGLFRWVSNDELEVLCRNLLQKQSVGAIDNKKLEYVDVDFDKYKDFKSRYDPDDDGIEKGFHWKRKLTAGSRAKGILNKAKNFISSKGDEVDRKKKKVDSSKCSNNDKIRPTRHIPNFDQDKCHWWSLPETNNVNGALDLSVYGQGIIYMKVVKVNDNTLLPSRLAAKKYDCGRRSALDESRTWNLPSNALISKSDEPTVAPLLPKVENNQVQESPCLKIGSGEEEPLIKTEGREVPQDTQICPSSTETSLAINQTIEKFPFWQTSSPGDGFPHVGDNKFVLCSIVTSVFVNSKIVGTRNPKSVKQQTIIQPSPPVNVRNTGRELKPRKRSAKLREEFSLERSSDLENPQLKKFRAPRRRREEEIESSEANCEELPKVEIDNSELKSEVKSKVEEDVKVPAEVPDTPSTTSDNVIPENELPVEPPKPAEVPCGAFFIMSVNAKAKDEVPSSIQLNKTITSVPFNTNLIKPVVTSSGYSQSVNSEKKPVKTYPNKKRKLVVLSKFPAPYLQPPTSEVQSSEEVKKSGADTPSEAVSSSRASGIQPSDPFSPGGNLLASGNSIEKIVVGNSSGNETPPSSFHSFFPCPPSTSTPPPTSISTTDRSSSVSSQEPLATSSDPKSQSQECVVPPFNAQSQEQATTQTETFTLAQNEESETPKCDEVVKNLEQSETTSQDSCGNQEVKTNEKVIEKDINDSAGTHVNEDRKDVCRSEESVTVCEETSTPKSSTDSKPECDTPTNKPEVPSVGGGKGAFRVQLNYFLNKQILHCTNLIAKKPSKIDDPPKLKRTKGDKEISKDVKGSTPSSAKPPSLEIAKVDTEKSVDASTPAPKTLEELKCTETVSTIVTEASVEVVSSPSTSEVAISIENKKSDIVSTFSEEGPVNFKNSGVKVQEINSELESTLRSSLEIEILPDKDKKSCEPTPAVTEGVEEGEGNVNEIEEPCADVLVTVKPDLEEKVEAERENHKDDNIGSEIKDLKDKVDVDTEIVEDASKQQEICTTEMAPPQEAEEDVQLTKDATVSADASGESNYKDVEENVDESSPVNDKVLEVFTGESSLPPTISPVVNEEDSVEAVKADVTTPGNKSLEEDDVFIIAEQCVDKSIESEFITAEPNVEAEAEGSPLSVMEHTGGALAPGQSDEISISQQQAVEPDHISPIVPPQVEDSELADSTPEEVEAAKDDLCVPIPDEHDEEKTNVNTELASNNEAGEHVGVEEVDDLELENFDEGQASRPGSGCNGDLSITTRPLTPVWQVEQILNKELNKPKRPYDDEEEEENIKLSQSVVDFVQANGSHLRNLFLCTVRLESLTPEKIPPKARAMICNRVIKRSSRLKNKKLKVAALMNRLSKLGQEDEDPSESESCPESEEEKEKEPVKTSKRPANYDSDIEFVEEVRRKPGPKSKTKVLNEATAAALLIAAKKEVERNQQQPLRKGQKLTARKRGRGRPPKRAKMSSTSSSSSSSSSSEEEESDGGKRRKLITRKRLRKSSSPATSDTTTESDDDENTASPPSPPVPLPVNPLNYQVINFEEADPEEIDLSIGERDPLEVIESSTASNNKISLRGIQPEQILVVSGSSDNDEDNDPSHNERIEDRAPYVEGIIQVKDTETQLEEEAPEAILGDLNDDMQQEPADDSDSDIEVIVEIPHTEKEEVAPKTKVQNRKRNIAPRTFSESVSSSKRTCTHEVTQETYSTSPTGFSHSSDKSQSAPSSNEEGSNDLAVDGNEGENVTNPDFILPSNLENSTEDFPVESILPEDPVDENEYAILPEEFLAGRSENIEVEPVDCLPDAVLPTPNSDSGEEGNNYPSSSPPVAEENEEQMEMEPVVLLPTRDANEEEPEQRSLRLNEKDKVEDEGVQMQVKPEDISPIAASNFEEPEQRSLSLIEGEEGGQMEVGPDEVVPITVSSFEEPKQRSPSPNEVDKTEEEGGRMEVEPDDILPNTASNFEQPEQRSPSPNEVDTVEKDGGQMDVEPEDDDLLPSIASNSEEPETSPPKVDDVEKGPLPNKDSTLEESEDDNNFSPSPNEVILKIDKVEEDHDVEPKTDRNLEESGNQKSSISSPNPSEVVEESDKEEEEQDLVQVSETEEEKQLGRDEVNIHAEESLDDSDSIEFHDCVEHATDESIEIKGDTSDHENLIFTEAELHAISDSQDLEVLPSTNPLDMENDEEVNSFYSSPLRPDSPELPRLSPSNNVVQPRNYSDDEPPPKLSAVI